MREPRGERTLDETVFTVYTVNGLFEWDDGKARRNALKHEIAFQTATFAFDDPHALILEDAKHSSREIRWRLIGDSGFGVMVVVFTIRAGCMIRLISARRAKRKERRTYEESRRF